MGYRAYPEYRDSGVEWLPTIPEGWEVRRLKFMTAIQNGRDYKEVENDEGFPVIGSGGQFTWASDFLYDGESVLFGRKGTIDKPLHIIGSFWTVDTMFYSIIQPGVFGRYLYYSSTTIHYEKLATQTAIPSITQYDLGDYWLCLPSLDEQRNIANFLDHKTAQIDRLIEKKRELIEKLQEQRIAIITLTVTRGLNTYALAGTCIQKWLGNIPDHWKRNQKLNYLSTDDRNSFVNGPFGSDLLTTELVDEGVPVIYSGDVKDTGFQRKSDKYVTEEKARQLDFCRVDGGDILLAKVGDPPGDACVYPLDQPSGIVTQDVVRIKVDKRTADPEYLCFLLNSEYGRHLVRLVSVEATRGRFSLADLKSIRHILPPLEEQQEIVLHIQQQMKRCNRLSDLAIQEIEALQEYRTALITAAVTGQIDVRDWQAPTAAEEPEPDKEVA
ncbi:restriction endonuclease subunit S [Pseudomonas oryzihabitans]|uniref:restriction endonuclease subunit S n=1 Tax=Pseudomonas oryzihabitans TaxID=47885 RepID=UPI002895DAFB|nr:restriction endonuclease subunit S [Pseudomonas oryzihabitans]MDT3721241.1 restriction endonuclease subunit S [Pseudomonas oryzihabitans]